VKNQPYYFEIKDLVTQFIAAFDDVIINRYNKDRTVNDKIQVRFLYAPKQRVVNDILNKSQHITLPAISVSVASISRDESRVFNKIFGSYNQLGTSDAGINTVSKFLPSPVPINVDISMSIITKFQTDMDQIISNFIPYTNPYLVISWKVPTELVTEVQEIRTEVLWSGDVSITYPEDLAPSSPYRVTADTTFTLKGWLFPDKSVGDGPNIFYVDTNFTPVTGFDYI
jgi:hypothetical protein